MTGCRPESVHSQLHIRPHRLLLSEVLASHLHSPSAVMRVYSWSLQSAYISPRELWVRRSKTKSKNWLYTHTHHHHHHQNQQSETSISPSYIDENPKGSQIGESHKPSLFSLAPFLLVRITGGGWKLIRKHDLPLQTFCLWLDQTSQTQMPTEARRVSEWVNKPGRKQWQCWGCWPTSVGLRPTMYLPFRAQATVQKIRLSFLGVQIFHGPPQIRILMWNFPICKCW